MTMDEIVMAGSGLQQIRGIGPAVARRLEDVGIGDVAALAAAPPERVAAALHGLPVVSRDRIGAWIEAAGRLAAPPMNTTMDNGQRYATFTLELLLDERGRVRRTRVGHVQSGRETSWAGWGERLLADFVAGCARAALMTDPVAPMPAMPETDAPAPAASGQLRLRDLATIPAGQQRPRHILRRGQPFDVTFDVDVSDAESASSTTALARTALYVWPLPGGQRRPVSQSETTMPLAPEMAVRVGPIAPGDLTPGAYRLQVEFTLEMAHTHQQVTAELREGLLLVY